MKNTKRLAAGFLGLCLAVSMAGPASAGAVTIDQGNGKSYTIGSDEFTVKFNGEAVTFPDAQPFVDENGRTLVPVRFVAETMGAEVGWDKATQTASIEKDGTTLAITIGQQNMSVTKEDSSETVQMDTAAVNQGGRTFVPIRFVAEALGAWVGYSDLFSTVQIYLDSLTPEEITRLHSYYDETWMEHLKASEDWGQEWTKGESDEEWEASNPEIAYFVGQYGFNNANEWKLTHPNDVNIRNRGWTWVKPTSYTGAVSGGTYTFGTQPDIDFAKMVLAEAIQGVNQELNKLGTLEINFRSDLSCVYASRHKNEAGTHVRGVLTVTIPQGADMNWIRNECDFISDPKAGETRDIDVLVNVNTFGAEVYWSKLAALK